MCVFLAVCVCVCVCSEESFEGVCCFRQSPLSTMHMRGEAAQSRAETGLPDPR